MATKYVIVIPDGCADDPVPGLGHRTPLQAANLPNMDRVATMGVVGLSNNVPATQTPASDVATLSLCGYDPLKVYTGRAPLETAAMGIPLGPNDYAIRCNLVNVPDGHMRDFTAGHIANEDGKELIEAMQKELGGKSYEGGTIEFFPGVQYRNILVWRGQEAGSPFEGLKTQAPHDIPDQPVEGYLPKGPGSGMLKSIMESSKAVFANHPANQRRIAQGKKPANQVWLWGQGKAPVIEPFERVYGIRGAMISAVDLVRGVGALMGWARIDVPGATGYLDTDYAAKGRYAIDKLKDFDIVCVHVEAPDEASHEGRADAKVEALEQIDLHIVGPVLAELQKYPDWKILVEPDHRTTLASRAHSYGAVPFAIAGSAVSPDDSKTYDEVSAAASGMVFDPGYQLMRWFLK
jgi:2,3-bisphosphoglycerate-independent phosphoglycerate mutase